MGLPRVKIINPSSGIIGTRYYINDREVPRVRTVDFRVSVDEIPTFTFETMGLPDIDMPGDIRFSFTPQTVVEATKVLRNELLKHLELRNGFLASIESALKEIPDDKEMPTADLAENILKRLIGEG